MKAPVKTQNKVQVKAPVRAPAKGTKQVRHNQSNSILSRRGRVRTHEFPQAFHLRYEVSFIVRRNEYEIVLGGGLHILVQGKGMSDRNWNDLVVVVDVRYNQ